MNEKQKRTLEAIARFGPIKKEDLKYLVPEYKPHEIPSAIDTLKTRGFITTQDEEDRQYNRITDSDVLIVNTNPFNMSKDGQQSLGGGVPDGAAVVKSSLPMGIETSESITIELTPEQSKLFERMRADVSHNCGTMNREEFMDWVLREARRMTEV